MENTQFDAIFVIMIIVIVVSVAFSVFKNVNGSIQNNKAPILEIPVRVMEKRVQRRKRNKNFSRNVFKVIFEDLDTLERHTFTVDELEFDQIVEGDIGYLKYQRKRYHAFQRDALAAEFEEDTTSNTDTQFKIED